jgi:hypothetical protein
VVNNKNILIALFIILPPHNGRLSVDLASTFKGSNACMVENKGCFRLAMVKIKGCFWGFMVEIKGL